MQPILDILNSVGLLEELKEYFGLDGKCFNGCNPQMQN